MKKIALALTVLILIAACSAGSNRGGMTVASDLGVGAGDDAAAPVASECKVADIDAKLENLTLSSIAVVNLVNYLKAMFTACDQATVVDAVSDFVAVNSLAKVCCANQNLKALLVSGINAAIVANDTAKTITNVPSVHTTDYNCSLLVTACSIDIGVDIGTELDTARVR